MQQEKHDNADEAHNEMVARLHSTQRMHKAPLPNAHQVLQSQLRCSPEGDYATLILFQDWKYSLLLK